MKKEILILMATYNGETYLETQLESILNQSNKNWDLLISDDNSSDHTVEIIEKYCKKYDNIKFLKHTPKNKALGNFSFLIKEAKKLNYNYIMFCDQDDFWLENKIEKTLNFMKNKEKNRPTLVFTDKEYVDNKLNSMRYNLGKYNKFNLEILLHQNIIYGCTMMLNKQLLLFLDNEIPAEFLNHDHYIALIANLLGEIYYLDYKSILYRQHDKNVSGNIKKTLIEKIKDREIYTKNIELLFFVANFIENKYTHTLNKKNKKIIFEIQTNIKKGGINAIYYALKNKIRKNTVRGSIKFWIELYLLKK